MPTSTVHTIEVPGARIDGTRWQIPVYEFRGSAEGPTTVLIAGAIGDKPLAVLALHEVRRRLEQLNDLVGTVKVVPVANPFGFQGMTRHNPDLMELNRRFPGRPSGFISDQVAHALATSLLDGADVLIDLHSGTPSRALWYTYDYGDVDLSASFGYLPVVVDRHVPGQFCTYAVSRGVRAFLAEFGGASRADMAIGVDGSWNTLHYLGHVPAAPTVHPLPQHVPVIDHVKIFLSSHEGVLVSSYSPHDVGSLVEPGVAAEIVDVMTGDTLEQFTVEAVGDITGTGPGFDLWGPAVERSFTVASKPLLMLANAQPASVHAGEFCFAVGWSDRSVELRALAGKDSP